jgi:hypothetical protein
MYFSVKTKKENKIKNKIKNEESKNSSNTIGIKPRGFNFFIKNIKKIQNNKYFNNSNGCPYGDIFWKEKHENIKQFSFFSYNGKTKCNHILFNDKLSNNVIEMVGSTTEYYNKIIVEPMQEMLMLTQKKKHNTIRKDLCVRVFNLLKKKTIKTRKIIRKLAKFKFIKNVNNNLLLTPTKKLKIIPLQGISMFTKQNNEYVDAVNVKNYLKKMVDSRAFPASLMTKRLIFSDRLDMRLGYKYIDKIVQNQYFRHPISRNNGLKKYVIYTTNLNRFED